MEAGVDGGYVSRNISKVLHAGDETGDIAVEEDGTSFCSRVERFAAEKCEAAIEIYSRTAEGIICTFEIAIIIKASARPDERAEVEAANEATVFSKQSIRALTNTYLSLYNGIFSFLTIEFGISGILEVDIAIVAESDVLCLKTFAVEMENRKVADSSLGLNHVYGENYLFWIV